MSSFYFHHMSDIFTFGKYKGMALCDVIAYDQNYVTWCINSIDRFRISKDTLKEIILIFPGFPITQEVMQHVGEERLF